MGLFNRHKKKQDEPQPAAQQPAPAEPELSIEILQRAANKVYPGLQMLARDVNLPANLAALYQPGMIICERGFTDATNRFMGMPTTHRFVILSNHMADFAALGLKENWGLHVAGAGSHFKVMGTAVCDGKTGIFLLHLPDDDDWKLWQICEFSKDEELYAAAKERFAAKCHAEIIPELATDEWLDRLVDPLGMDAQGNFFPLEKAPTALVNEAPAADKSDIKDDKKRKKASPYPVYTLEYLKSFEGVKREYRPGGIQLRHDDLQKKWRLVIQLDENWQWFLSVFIFDDGTFDKFCLDDEAAYDSHYEFVDEAGLRKAIRKRGDEKRYLGEVLIRYVAEEGINALCRKLTPFITAEFHY